MSYQTTLAKAIWAFTLKLCLPWNNNNGTLYDSLPDEENEHDRKRKAISMNPFEMSDDEDVDLSTSNHNANEDHDDFEELTQSRDTTSFYDTIDENDSKYHSTYSNMWDSFICVQS